MQKSKELSKRAEKQMLPWRGLSFLLLKKAAQCMAWEPTPHQGSIMVDSIFTRYELYGHNILLP